MKQCALSVCLVFVATTHAAFAQAPEVVFPTPIGPGLQVPFNSSDDGNPTDYGVKHFLAGVNFDADLGWMSISNAFFRYCTSPQGDTSNAAAMLESNDWVFHVEYLHTGNYNPAGGDIMLFSKHEFTSGREDRMFSFFGVASTNWEIRVGDNAGGWNTVVSGLPMTNASPDLINIDVHYRASVPTFDFYWDDVFVGSAQTGHGRYDLDFIQVEPIKHGLPEGFPTAGVDRFRNWRVGHVLSAVELTPVTEPQTVALEWSTEAQALYELECSTDPAGNAWDSTGQIIRGDGAVRFAYDPAAPGNPSKLYRLVLLP